MVQTVSCCKLYNFSGVMCFSFIFIFLDFCLDSKITAYDVYVLFVPQVLSLFVSVAAVQYMLE